MRVSGREVLARDCVCTVFAARVDLQALDHERRTFALELPDDFVRMRLVPIGCL